MAAYNAEQECSSPNKWWRIISRRSTEFKLTLCTCVQWYTSAASKAEEYNVSINKWQVYLRSISNRSEQCLYLVTQRSQFFWYLYTPGLQWKLFLVYEMHCWSLCMNSIGRSEVFSVQITLIQFSRRIVDVHELFSSLGIIEWGGRYEKKWIIWINIQQITIPNS